MTDQGETARRVADEALARRIEKLQLAYVHCIDDGELDRWPDYFIDPCLYRVIGRDNIENGLELGVMRFESVDMLRDRATPTRHAAVFAPRRKALLAFGQNNPGEIGTYHRRLVLCAVCVRVGTTSRPQNQSLRRPPANLIKRRRRTADRSWIVRGL